MTSLWLSGMFVIRGKEDASREESETTITEMEPVAQIAVSRKRRKQPVRAARRQQSPVSALPPKSRGVRSLKAGL